MKNITVSKKTREEIRNIAEDNESVDDVITRLLENVEKPSFDTDSRRTTINISEANLIKLKQLKEYPKEPVSKVVARLISEKGKTD